MDSRHPSPGLAILRGRVKDQVSVLAETLRDAHERLPEHVAARVASAGFELAAASSAYLAVASDTDDDEPPLRPVG
jgi:hypothetical protein